MTYQVLDKIANKEVVYFENSFELLAYRFDPEKEKYYAKYRNQGKEFEVANESRALNDAFTIDEEISKAKYEQY